jgi:geranylgeranyl pyrophosphate synthase
MSTSTTMECLYEPITYTMSLNGKHTRRLLIKYVQNMIGNDNHPVTKLIENDINYFHVASLVIDDIQDESEKRRGEPCAYKIFGVASTINAGYLQCFTLLNSIPHKYPTEISSDVQSYFISALEKIHIGQGCDLLWTKTHTIPPTEDFLQMIDNKTGVLFKLIGQLCFLTLGNMHTVTDENCHNILLLLQMMGRFFQIRDDYINITSPAYWRLKVFCEDFDEKKVSYLFVRHKENTGSDELYQELVAKDNMTHLYKMYLYEQMFNTKILHQVYLELDHYKNEIIKLENIIMQKEGISEFLDIFFKKLEFNAPISPKDVTSICKFL